MSWVAVAVGGGAIVGGYIASKGAGDAAQTQADAANRASDAQQAMYMQQREDATPWRYAGMRALGGMESGDFQRDFTMNDFQKDPGYDFRMQEGQKALERSAAARGGLQSGATMKALSRYGQDFASNEYSNAYNRFNSDRDRRFNRLASLAGLGQTANSQVMQAGQNAANQIGQNTVGAANAIGASQIAQSNIWGNTLSGLGQNYMNYSMMNKMMSK